MKKVNYLGFMGLISLLGLIGIFTPNRGFIGFFGFLAYLRYFTVIPDELFKQHTLKAASSGFFSWLAVTTISIPVTLLLGIDNALSIVFVAGFVSAIFVFSVVLVYCEIKEQRGCDQ